MRLPKAIQEAIDRADEVQKQATAPTDTPAVAQIPVEPQTQVASDPPAEPAAPVAPPTPAPDVDWEHKYKTLQGMFTAQNEQMRATNQQLTQQVSELTTKLTELTKQQAQPTRPATPLVTDKDKEAFGEDLLDLMRRTVHQETTRIQAENQELRAEITKLTSQLGNVSERQTVDARQVFFDVLNREVPNWQQLNQDPAFMAWLKETDEVYGVPRQMALDDAGNKLDGKRAAAIFNVYNKLVRPATPQPPDKGLERQVVPSTKRTGPAPTAQPEKPIFTTQQIEQFYEAWRRGQLTPEQIAAGEAAINAAVAEGRVR